MTHPSTPITESVAHITLRDGSRVRVRQSHSSAKQLLLRAFERLSAESRYRRFLAAMPELSEETVRYLIEIDHHDHEAIAAFDEDAGEGDRDCTLRSQPRATRRGRSLRCGDRRLAGSRASARLLLEVLGARARTAGINSFTALILATNEHMLHVLEALGSVRIVDRDVGTVEIEVPIPQTGSSPQTRRLLRVVARNDVVVVPPADRPGTRRLAPGA